MEPTTPPRPGTTTPRRRCPASRTSPSRRWTRRRSQRRTTSRPRRSSPTTSPTTTSPTAPRRAPTGRRRTIATRRPPTLASPARRRNPPRRPLLQPSTAGIDAARPALSRQDLAAVLAVQDLDLLADQLRHRRAHLPARSALAGLDRQIESANAELAAIEATLADVEARQAAAEAELAEAERRAASLSTRLYGGSVTASRELSAMSTELDQLKARSSAMEDAVLALMEERDPLEARSAEVAARRAEAASAVPSGLLEPYERLRSRLDGVGAARLVGNRCDGCHLTLPAVELDRIRRLPDGEVYTCDQCSRILVPDL